MKECTNHLCKRLVGEHYAATGAASGSDTEGEDLDDAGIDAAAMGGHPCPAPPAAPLTACLARAAPPPCSRPLLCPAAVLR